MGVALTDFALSHFIDVIGGEKNQLTMFDVGKTPLDLNMDENARKHFFSSITHKQIDKPILDMWQKYIKDFKLLGYDLCVLFTDIGLETLSTYNASTTENALMQHKDGKINGKNKLSRPMSAHMGGRRKGGKQCGGGKTKSRVGFFFLRKNNQIAQDPNGVVPFEDRRSSEADRLLNTLKPILLPEPSVPSYSLPSAGPANETFFDIYRKLKAEEHRFKATSFGLQSEGETKDIITIMINQQYYNVTAQRAANNKVTFNITSNLPRIDYTNIPVYVTHIAIRDFYTGKSKIIDAIETALRLLPTAPPRPATPPSAQPEQPAKDMTATELKQVLVQLFSKGQHELTASS